MLPLEMWYSSQRGDHFLVGTADNRANAIGAGYVLQYVDSYVPPQWVTWPSVVPPGSPFAHSTDLLGYDLAWGMAAVPPGIGADTWYPTWTDVQVDNTSLMLSSWTDGSVNGVGSSSADSPGHNATTGMAWVHGNDPWHLTIANASIYTEPAAPYQGRYPSICQYVDGVWYYGTYSLENWRNNGDNPAPDCGNWCVLGPLTDIRTSTDLGATWTAPRKTMSSWTDNLWGEAAVNNSKVVMGAPHAVDFGKNLQYSPDGRMYLVATGAIGPNSYQSWMQGDTVHLARTVARPDPTRINDADFWEFWTGGHGVNATWSAPGEVTTAAPLFTWPNRTGVVTASYAPALSKYLMVVSTPTTSPSTVAHFDTYLLEADDITGPYSLITYMPSYGPQAYFVHWPSMFMASNVSSSGEGTWRQAAGRVARPGVRDDHPMLLQAQQAMTKARTEGVGLLQAAAHASDSLRLEQQAMTKARTEGVGLLQAAAHASDSLRLEQQAMTLPVDTDITATPQSAAGYWTSYLSYSGNFASGYAPSPPGTGYHWTLQLARLGLSHAMVERMRGGDAVEGKPHPQQAQAAPPSPLTGPGITNLSTGGYWDADLGVPLVLPTCTSGTDCTWVLLGDLMSTSNISRTPNAIGQLKGGAVGGLAVDWAVQADGLAAPFFPLLGQSTVPAGAISIPSPIPGTSPDLWLFMMNVSYWPTQPGQDQHANGMLVHGSIGQDGRPTFDPTPVWSAPRDGPLVNAAPVLDGQDSGTVWLFATGQYRASPMYLAKAQAGSLGSLASYSWWGGQANGTGPAVWGDYPSATPILAGPSSSSWVGELSVAYDGVLGLYVLCYMDYSPAYAATGPVFVCQSAPHPTGPWSSPKALWTNDPASWSWWGQDPLPQGWGDQYGGYLLNLAGGRATVMLSLWHPYRVFAIQDVQVV